MVIDHVNALLTGGAAMAARRLHQGLLTAGLESRLWHSRAAGDSGQGLRPIPWPLPDGSWQGAVRRRIREGSRAIQLRLVRSYHRRGRRRRFGAFIGSRRASETPFVPSLFDGDILHLHWVAGFIDYRSFFGSMPDAKPLVWTLHDMTPLTGGCSHAEDCREFLRTCGHCPILARPGPRDLSFTEFRVKRDALRGRPFHVVAPSRWMAERAAESAVTREAQVHVIRNPIDLARFRPADRLEARRTLGIPEDAVCLLYAAESLENRPKGVEEFIATLARLRDVPKLLGLAFGRGRMAASVAGVPIHCLGFLASPEEQRLAYSAADVFVMPSHMETISQTIVEAFACGTPTVAFAVGGVPELVHDGDTGFLAPLRDVEHMSARVRWLIDHPLERRRMGDQGMALVRRDYEVGRQVRQHVDLYRHVLGSH